jgi:hypothetical protein
MVVGMRVTHPSAALVAWGNAWLTGHVGLDEAADALERLGGPHLVSDVPGEGGDAPLRRGLGALRVAGMSALRLALPAPGDPLGLSGPPEFNTAAIEAGEAVLVSVGARSLGLIPAEDRRGSSYVGTRWTVHETRPGIADAPLLPEADHQLTNAMREATESLLSVDGVLDWRPEVAESLSALRESHAHEQAGGLAPGYPARAHRVAALAGRLAVVVDLARGTEGAGLSAVQVRRRGEALRALDRAVRRARVAACNSVLDPVG